MAAICGVPAGARAVSQYFSVNPSQPPLLVNAAEPLINALKRVGFIGSPHASRFRVRTHDDSRDPFHGWLLMPGDSDGDLLVSGAISAPSE